MSKFKDRLSGLVAKDKSTALLTTCVLIAAVVFLNIIIYTVTGAFGLYIYQPETTDLTISGKTDSLFASVPEGREVTVTFCMDEEDLKAHSTGSYVWMTVDQFAERYSFIKVKYVNMLTKRDENGDLFPFDNYTTDMKGNETAIRKNTVIFSSGANYRVITDTYTSAGFADFFSLDANKNAYAYNGEEVVASMISWVLNDEHGVAYMTEKHGETADVALANMLTCAGYYVDIINLRDNEVPSDAELVVISNPTTDFYRLNSEGTGRSEIERLDDYLSRGGNLYVIVDPFAKKLPVLEGFLSEWGISLASETDEKGVFSRAIVRDSSMGVSFDGHAFTAGCADNNLGGSINSTLTLSSSGRVLVGTAAGLVLDESLGAKPLLVTSDAAELVIAGETVEDSRGVHAVAAYSERENDNGTYGKIAVIPTVYLTAADAMTSDVYSNGDFIYLVWRNLFGAKTAPVGCKTVTYNHTALENFTARTANILTAVVLAIPLVLAAAGTAIIIRRKNR